MNTQVDLYFVDGCMRCELGATPACKVNAWKDELQALRGIILQCDVKEVSKWGVPCYTVDGKNAFLLSALKDFCTISFFNGALMKDPDGVLEKPGKNSQAARYMKFTEMSQITSQEDLIKQYIQEAVEIDKVGLTVPFKKNPEPIPEELENRMQEDPMLKSAFESLTPGRQRGYIIYFSAPKKPETRYTRIDKCTAKILNGEGLNDRYSGRKK